LFEWRGRKGRSVRPGCERARQNEDDGDDGGDERARQT